HFVYKIDTGPAGLGSCAELAVIGAEGVELEWAEAANSQRQERPVPVLGIEEELADLGQRRLRVAGWNANFLEDVVGRCTYGAVDLGAASLDTSVNVRHARSFAQSLVHSSIAQRAEDCC